MSKNKAVRDVKAAAWAEYERLRQERMVRASPLDLETTTRYTGHLWRRLYPGPAGELFYQVQLLPPNLTGLVFGKIRETWRVRCSNTAPWNDRPLVREFKDEQKARDIFLGINDGTRIATLISRGFKYVNE